MIVLGIALLALGTALVVAEAHLPTFGVVGSAGVVALVAGVVLALEGAGAGLLLVLVVAAIIGTAAAFAVGIGARAALRVSRQRSRTGTETLIGRVGVVREAPAPLGQVFVDGALWRAQPCFDDELREGDPIVVERVRGLTLSVRRAEDWELEA